MGTVNHSCIPFTILLKNYTSPAIENHPHDSNSIPLTFHLYFHSKMHHPLVKFSILIPVMSPLPLNKTYAMHHLIRTKASKASILLPLSLYHLEALQKLLYPTSLPVEVPVREHGKLEIIEAKNKEIENLKTYETFEE